MSNQLPKNLIIGFIVVLLFVIIYNIFLRCYICEGYENDKKNNLYK